MRKTGRNSILILAAAALCRGQDSKPVELVDQLAARIPEPYRTIAKSTVTLPAKTQQSWLTVPADDLMIAMIGQLASTPEGIRFLLQRLANEAAPVWRARIIGALSGYWRSHPAEQPIVERYAASDPDAQVSLEALEVLRSIRMTDLENLFETRLAVARDSHDEPALAALVPLQERWFSLRRGTMLPSFLRVPPQVFSVKPAGQPIRVLAFGDFGTGSPAQVDLAKAMVAYHKTRPFDFGITLGDNFYLAGMASTEDPRWRTQWEDLYGSMGIRFYAALGNHDWVMPDSPAAEILYSAKSPDWRMPSPYYTFTAGPAQFFVVDEDGAQGVELSQAQLDWLDKELAKSTALWKVVYGHFPIYSSTRGDNQILIDSLLPILKKRKVDVYLNGHDHNLQEQRPEGGLHFFVSGGGGVGLAAFNPYDRTVYQQMVYGFSVLEANNRNFTVTFVDTDGKELYRKALSKNE